MERQETKMGGNIVTLIGPKLEEGEEAPDFSVLDNDLMPKHLDYYQGKVKLISVVLSIDTKVFDFQTR